MNILETYGLDKSFGPIHAVQNLSLQVEEGQVCGILGPNGSGKTTTLGMILGTTQPDKGSYRWFEKGNGPEMNRQIGALVEGVGFYPYLNLIRNLKILCRIKGVKESDIERVLRLTGLWSRRKSKFSTLSFGMKQRLALAGVLLGDPKVLVLDEPTNGLDPEGIAEVRELITKVAETGKTILLASHILDEVEKVCTHVAILKQGNLLVTRPVDGLTKARETVLLAASSRSDLKKALDESGMVASMAVHGEDGFEIELIKGVQAAELNKKLIGSGIVLTRLEMKKQTLEEQFLELVKHN